MKRIKRLLIALFTLCAVCVLSTATAAADDVIVDPELIFNPQTTLTVFVDGAANDMMSGNYPYGESAMLTAPNLDRKTFQYWTNAEGAVISYNANLTLTMYAHTTVNAVYGTSGATAKTTAEFLNITRTDGEIIFNAVASANESITEVGIRYSTTKKTLNDLKGAEDVTVEKAEGTSTNWSLIVTPDDEDTTYYAVAYATAGAETTYSAVKEVKLSDLQHGVSMVLNLGNLDLSTLNAEFCVVTFDSNGGEGVMELQGFVKDAAATLNVNTFTREGYSFVGWNTAADGTGTSYKDKESITSAANLTLYAVWGSTVSFAANGGTGTMADETGVIGQYTLPACTFTAPEGKTFDRWEVNGTQYAAGAAIIVSANTTVKALWKDIPAVTYTVTFNANGGQVSPSSSVTNADGKLASLPTPTRSGYRFDGWYDALTGGSKVTSDTVFKANAEIYARWTKNSTGGYSGGGDNSSTPAATITVPVTGDTGSVSVSASVSGTTATIKAPTTAQLDKVIGESVKTGEVTVDVSGLNRNIATVSIPAETVKAIEKAVSDPDNDADALTVRLTDGSVTFDAAALAAIVDQAKGSTIQLNLDGITESGLRTAQKTAIKDMDVQTVYDAYITSNGQRISDFKGGKATVTVPYELKAAQRAAGVTVWYVADNGDKTEMPSTCDGKDVKFTVEHFSNYVVAYDASRVTEDVSENRSYEICKKDNTCPISKFTDADPTAWYHDGVHYALDEGIMNGTGGGKFEPDKATTRAMIVTMLWRMKGEPEYHGTLDFTDAEDGAWYTGAIRWAASEGIVNGYDETTFGPNDSVTREQLATILYRYAQSKGEGFKGSWMFLLDFPDAGDVSEWADEAMHWMVMNDIINGMGDGTLNPGGEATRAQVATMLMRYNNFIG